MNIGSANFHTWDRCPEGEARRNGKHHTRRGPVPRRWGSALIVLYGGGSKATPPCACGQDLLLQGGRKPAVRSRERSLLLQVRRLAATQQLITTQYDSARHRTRSDPIAVTVIPGAAYTDFSVEKPCADHSPTLPTSHTVPAAGRHSGPHSNVLPSRSSSPSRWQTHADLDRFGLWRNS